MPAATRLSGVARTELIYCEAPKTLHAKPKTALAQNQTGSFVLHSLFHPDPHHVKVVLSASGQASICARLFSTLHLNDYARNHKYEPAPMVKVSKEVARKHQDSVVNAASVAIREHGIAEASVADIARAAGLTHGAIYRHFPSKSALVAAAIRFEFDRIIGVLMQLQAQDAKASSYADLYLSPDHRDHFHWGCPAAPLAAEIHRLEAEVQTAFRDGLNGNIAALAALINPADPIAARAEAITMLSALLGALSLARATSTIDPGLSGEILQVMREKLATK
jgi:TetR/AcrR family transcriptional regulator, transcriptional repressor for nem operon